MQWEPLLIKGHIVTRVSTTLPTGPEGPVASQSTARPLVGSLAREAGLGLLWGTWQAHGAGMTCSLRPGPTHSVIWG